MLNGKRALVTGSTSGIGLGIARALAAKGASVMLNGFGDGAEIEALRAGLAREFGVTVLYNGADLSRPDGAGDLVRDTQARLGGLDILVNNAGIQHVAPVEEFPLERWDSVIAINLTAVFQAIRAALPGMKAQGWGRIVNVASVHGLVASVNKAAYIAAKHGVVGLTKVVGLETAEIDITCNAICPGWVLTPLVQKQIDTRAEAQGVAVEEAGRDLLSEKQPSKKFTTPEQIGDLAVFLCSSAAANMTGSALTMDGGWAAQ
ncbi:dehydrogenase [Paramagnetospirillum caucaseum]|uniref:Dehydrogenase n=1 Tax=Paramagnetospirillum caucaseum TaxID=1244869 RepID=M2ZV86_9PROT|nr:3-hydroxybutyrate dehydrogenase [Paramagnetospirillum caucaseum]EME71312.1 dehydrogenase [Paramagnetospirillum caucaseum]